MPRYPIYIPSLGRADTGMTARSLQAEGTPFHLVVEANEFDLYRSYFPSASVLAMPESGYGHLSYARNFCKDHAQSTGSQRHWQVDDNIKEVRYYGDGSRRVVAWDVALGAVEDRVDRYENIDLAGLIHQLFAWKKTETVTVNQMCYCTVLVANQNPARWRPGVCDDIDYSLQILFGGRCTLLVNEYALAKAVTMTMKGGCTSASYQGDGRLKLIRGLQSAWPAGLIGITRRFGYPKAVTSHIWRTFPQRPQLKQVEP